MDEFAQISVVNKKTPKQPRHARQRLSREEVDRRFVEQWRRGREAWPDVYPAGQPGIDNVRKEAILRKIRRGENPEEAFLAVLVTDMDD